MGEAFERLDDRESAMEAFLIAAPLSPDKALPYAKLFQLVGGLEDRIAAIEAFDRWVQTFVGENDLRKALWKLDRCFGRCEERAEKILFCHLSRILMFMDRGEEAVEAFSKSTLPAEDASASEDKDHQTLQCEYREMAGSYDSGLVARHCSKTLADFAIGSIEAGPGIRLLDAACGTGLVGLRLRAWADEIVGIDLSPGMLAEAERKGVYDELTIGDISNALKEHDGSFDLVTCAEGLYHLSDLSGFFAGAASRLVPGGMLAVSVDPCADQWQIRATILGGFAHSRSYLRRLAVENGLAEIQIQILEHRAHPGFYAAFQKQ